MDGWMDGWKVHLIDEVRGRMIATMEAPSPSHRPTIFITTPEKSSTTHFRLWGLLIVVLAVCMVGGTLFLLIRRKLFPFFKQRWTRKGSLKAEKLMLRKFQMEELEKATNNFSEECLLGSGGFGNVYKATFEGKTSLAIKKAHADSYQSIEEFRNEVRLLSKVNHKNLVGLVGFCEGTGAKRSQVLVYEYVPNGSLLEYIMGRGGRILTWRQRVKIAIGAAKGIAHLHDGIKPSIIHRDIKPSNILIGDGFEAKVSDFGLVKIGPSGDQSHVSSQIKGTPGYLDPAYCSSLHLSPFSDVYSFGVILLQLISARPAVDRARDRISHHIIDWARPSLESGNIEEIVDANLLSQHCNMEMMLNMGRLGLRCVVNRPKDRPTMSCVWQELQDALYTSDNFICKEPRGRSSRKSYGDSTHRSSDHDYSQSFVSIDGVGLQRFRIEMDSISSNPASLRCFENTSVDINTDINNLRGITEETSGDAK